MAEFEWSGNSEKMFEELIKGSPAPMRPTVRKGLIKALAERVGEGGTVTEEDIEEATRATTPRPFVKRALARLEPLKSEPPPPPED